MDEPRRSFLRKSLALLGGGGLVASGTKGAGAGDQLVAVKIVMPSDMMPTERELYEKLNTLRSDNPRAYLG